jgi:signal transduction histidine kinase
VRIAVQTALPCATDVRVNSGNDSIPTFSFVASIRDGDRPLGVLIIAYSALALQQILETQSAASQPGSSGLLYDENDILLAGPVPVNRLMHTSRRFTPAKRDSLLAAGRLLITDDDTLRRSRRVEGLRFNRDSVALFDLVQIDSSGASRPSLAAAVTLRAKPWHVVFSRSRDAVVAASTGPVVRDAVALALGSAVLVLVLAVLVSERLTQPLVRLAGFSEQFAAGDLTARAAIDSDDEIGQLGRAFDHLADRVGTLVIGLGQRTKELEEDIAKREALEAELLQSRKLEAIGRLAGGIAHDFNNLLTVITATVDIAADASATEAEVQESLKEINAAALRGAALTQHLLAFARRGEIAPRTLALSEEIEGMRTMLRRLIGSHIVLEIHAPADLWPVRIDPTQLQQAILNLASNARDAMTRDGALTIIVRNAEQIPSLDGSDGVILEVSDTGTGMDAATASRIFEPFFSTKERGRGTGLGLSTVYGIVAQAGGHIAVETAVGRGTTFRICLPRAHGTAEMEIPSVIPEVRQGRGERILVVEDDESVRVVIARVLRQAGYEVITANDADHGRQVGEERLGELDLVLSDVVMRGGGGLAMVEHLRTLRPTLRAILMSGYSLEARQAFTGSALDLPMLEKPFSASVLVRRVHDSLHAPA